MGCSDNPVSSTENAITNDYIDVSVQEKECEWWEFWEDCD